MNKFFLFFFALLSGEYKSRHIGITTHVTPNEPPFGRIVYLKEREKKRETMKMRSFNMAFQANKTSNDANQENIFGVS